MVFEQIKELISSLNEEQKNILIAELTSKKTTSNKSLYDSLKENKQQYFCCPHCGSAHIRKDGNVYEKQRFECCDCKKKFGYQTKTIFSGTWKDKEKWTSFINQTISHVSIRNIAENLQVSKNTILDWRHKLIKIIGIKMDKVKLQDIIEVDDTYFKKSSKGLKGMKQTKKKALRGISRDKLCFTTGVDRNNNVVCVFNGYGKNSVEKMQKCFSDKIDVEKTMLVLCDKDSAYKTFFDMFRIEIKQSKAENWMNHSLKRKSKGIYNINSVNSLHSMMKEIIRDYRGVQQKYLLNYLQLCCWMKQESNTSLIDKVKKMFYDLCNNTFKVASPRC